MDDEEENEQLPPFRWNWQAVFMVCFFALALAIPLMGVVWFLNGYMAVRPVAAPSVEAKVDTASLEQGLERVSDAQFSGSVKIQDEGAVKLDVAKGDMDARIARISKIAKEAGGGALEMSEAGAASRRVMATVPAARADLFRRAIRGDSVDFSAIPPGASTRMVEIELGAP